MNGLSPRLAREQRTMEAMVGIYCRGHHQPAAGEVCEECRDLLAFTEFRLSKCPHGDDKPTCAKCPIHCYLPARREQVRTVMRFAGPRMMLRHPLFALRHWLDGFRKAPPLRRGAPARSKG